MNAKRFVTSLLVLLAAGLIGSATAPAETTAGEAVFKSRCANCHTLTGGLSTIAPDLTGVVGRKAGSLKGYQYSAALRTSDIVWTAEKLEQWLSSPHGVAVETEMAFTGLKGEKEREDLIGFLKQHVIK
ncbi:MAG: c-type cytochrome [Candidatus Binatia bacterium]